MTRSSPALFEKKKDKGWKVGDGEKNRSSEDCIFGSSSLAIQF
jgi:hypothetical protein